MSREQAFVAPFRTPKRRGSLLTVSHDIQTEIHNFENLLTVDGDKLRWISDCFIKELDQGLSKEGGSIPMNPTWVMGYPHGKEKGSYLALDMGGTNIRVCEVILEGDGKFDIIQSKYKMDESLKHGDPEPLWKYMAECVARFVEENHEGNRNESLHLGFTFSYPVTQHNIQSGVLQRWTKGFDINNTEGKDVVPIFNEALKKAGSRCTVSAVINDTTGTMIASNYKDHRTKIGCIFGTGCNAAYMEHASSIKKLDHLGLDPDQEMAINCEWGAFDNEHRYLPRTQYDVMIDEQSPRPGQQSFEKMIAGLYLGEILRLILLDLHSQGKILKAQDVGKLQKQYAIDTSILSEVEVDPFENLSETHVIFERQFGLNLDASERALVRRLVELIGIRSARLSHTGIAAVVKKKNIKECLVGADGSVFNKYPKFKDRGQRALAEMLGEEWGSKIDVVPAVDGSGVGAAVIAAMTAERKSKGILPDL